MSCDKCRNVLLKTRLEVRFDLLRCGIYEKCTTWEFHGESFNQFKGDNSRENNENEGGYDSDEVNILEDACGVAGMGLGIETEKYIEEHIHEQPTGEAAKFYPLLKEYQEPLSSNEKVTKKMILLMMGTLKFFMIQEKKTKRSSMTTCHKMKHKGGYVGKAVGKATLLSGSRSNHTINGRSIRSSNSIDNDEQAKENKMILGDSGFEENPLPRMEDMTNQTSKRKRMNTFFGKLTTTLEAQEAANPCEVEVDPINVSIHGFTNSVIDGNVGNNEGKFSNLLVTYKIYMFAMATSTIKKKGEREKYKSYVVDMKIKGKQSKLSICTLDKIDRAIGGTAPHLENKCDRVVRTRVPLDEAFTRADDGMWKEIQVKFEIEEGGCYLKMQAFVIDMMQHLYRKWKTHLHYYYKTPKYGKTDEEHIRNPPADLSQDQWEYSVKRFSSIEFKKITERNSQNRGSNKRCTHTTGNLSFVETEDISKISERNSQNRGSDKKHTHTTGNLSFAEVEDILTKENKNVKPTADVIWLAERTRKSD
ncbi:hypothetical protein Cgig2_006428 [Carnegiea gigantea]|uniref:Uncharacterized protein n=1 Tax=Carnegiea gigantea TaxID=171969 RepID=A0A9Q1JKX9_9CARY|nr:hypothetical protein Cgig2_006428 [Carnegiea gigantea]